MIMFIRVLLLIFLISVATQICRAKDIASFEGLRTVQLIGYVKLAAMRPTSSSAIDFDHEAAGEPILTSFAKF